MMAERLVPRLVAYGHSWVGGAGATSSARGLVAVAVSRLGIAADNLAVGGSSSTETAARLVDEAPPASRLYL